MKKTYTLWPDKPTIRHNLLEYLEGLDRDKAWDVVISPHRTPLTTHQRGGFHFLCEALGDELGIPKGVVKEIAKGQLVGFKTINLGGIEMTVADGSSEEMEKMEYSQLIDVVYQLAGEAGVVLPELERKI